MSNQEPRLDRAGPVAGLRFWWVEEGDSPAELPSFPFHCHKFIVLREEHGAAHVVASDSRLDQHADIFRVLVAGVGSGGPDGMLAGGGHGENFPGVSQAFGPPPADVIRAILGEDEGESSHAEVPSWVMELVRRMGCRSVEDLILEAEDDPLLMVTFDAVAGLLELERYDEDWKLEVAVVPAQVIFDEPSRPSARPRSGGTGAGV